MREALEKRLAELRDRATGYEFLGCGYSDEYVDGYVAAILNEIEFLESLLAPSEQKQFEGYA